MESIGFGSNKIVVSVPPCEQPTSVEWGVNLAGFSWPLNVTIEYSSQDGVGEDSDVLRNYAAGYASGTKARYIWFLKADVLPPSWAVMRLIEAFRMDPTIMVCAAMSLTNVPEETDFTSTIQRVIDGDEEFEVLEVASDSFVNLECTMVRADVFDHIEEPWFKNDNTLVSEAGFCQKVMKAGFKVTAHSGVLCGRVDMTTGKPEWPAQAVVTP